MGKRALVEANQCLVDWLSREIFKEELRDKSSKRALRLRYARRSLANFPEELRTEDDLRRVHGIGTVSAGMLYRARCEHLRVSHLNVTASQATPGESNLSGNPAKRKPSSNANSCDDGGIHIGQSPKRRRSKVPLSSGTLGYATILGIYSAGTGRESLAYDIVATNVQTFRRERNLTVPSTERVFEYCKRLENEGYLQRFQSPETSVEFIQLTDQGYSFARDIRKQKLVEHGAQNKPPFQSLLPGASVLEDSPPKTSSLTYEYGGSATAEKETDKAEEDDDEIEIIEDSCSLLATKAHTKSSSSSSGLKPMVSSQMNFSGELANNVYKENSQSFAQSPICLQTLKPKPLSGIKKTFGRGVGQHPEWELILLVDSRENKKRDRSVVHSKLLEQVPNVETRSLSLGDFMWIVRSRLENKKEYVLDYIIERKEVADLASSIKDNRYKEQKYRLQRCGLKRVIYLVEGDPSQQTSINPLALRTAMARTQIRDGITLVHTESFRDSLDFIVRMHYIIADLTVNASCDEWLRSTINHGRTYEAFSLANAKGKLRTVGEIFAAQLKQIKGISGAMAEALTKQFATPRTLCRLYQNQLRGIPEEQQARHLQDVIISKTSRRLGPVCSERVFRVFNQRVITNNLFDSSGPGNE